VRRRRGALAILMTLFLSLLATGFAGWAAAGGPTSVLLVVPGEGRTASLYHGSAEYEELVNLLDAHATPMGSSTPPAGADNQGASGTNEDSGPGVTVTWLMHDVAVWRVDRVYLNAKGGPLISTQTNIGGDEDFLGQPPTWHEADDNAKALIMLLDRLGVGNAGATAPESASGSGSGSNQQPVAAPGADPTVADPSVADPSAADRDTGTFGSGGWLWGPLGVLLGIGLTLVAVRWWRVGEAGDGADAGSGEPAGDTARPDTGDTAGPETAPADEAGRAQTETLSSHPAR
jgi:hypothetical protein